MTKEKLIKKWEKKLRRAENMAYDSANMSDGSYEIHYSAAVEVITSVLKDLRKLNENNVP